MYLYYSELEDNNAGHARYYLNGDRKVTVKVTHTTAEKDEFLVAPPSDIVYVGEGNYGWSHRMNTLRKLKERNNG